METHRGTSAGRQPPLAGFTVLDFTTALAGPQVTWLLGALGARVIKVEAPAGSDMARLNPPYACDQGVHFQGPLHDDDQSISALSRLRNKESILIDAKTPAGAELIASLMERADILVHNFREESAARMGIDSERARTQNPGLIYCAISAFGASEDHGRAGMDIMIQALSGLMSVTGDPAGPPMRVGLPVADFVTPLYATIGILAAVVKRASTGVAETVDVAMLDTITSLVASEHFDVLDLLGMPTRTGNSLARMGPFGCYQTLDGHVAIAASQDTWCHDLFRVMGRPEFIADRRTRSRGARVENSALLDEAITEWTSRLHTDDVVARLLPANVPCAPVRTATEALDDAGPRDRGAVVPLEDIGGRQVSQVRTGGIPIVFDSFVPLNLPARPPGADTDAVLAGLLGLSPVDVAELHRDGVVAGP